LIEKFDAPIQSTRIEIDDVDAFHNTRFITFYCLTVPVS